MGACPLRVARGSSPGSRSSSTAQDTRDHPSSPSASPPASAPTSRARSPRPAGARCRSSPRWTATASSPAPARSRGDRGHGARAPGRGAAGRDAAAQPPERPARAVGPRSQRRRAAARRRRRLRHHRQRRHRALRRGRGAARPRGAADRPVRRRRHAGRARAGRGGSWASTRTGRASATWPRTSPTATTTAACCCSRPAPGVGKSFAYLVPALAWARANGERTVVSTNTINLQEQLVGKDLPLLAGRSATDELHADVRPAQGLAELPLPRAAAPGGGLAADAARAGQARRAARASPSGPGTRPTAR